jgi:hypothetical protein
LWWVLELVHGDDYWPDNPTEAQKQQLRAVAQELKGKGFVHGDLRQPNIILVRDEKVYIIIDFDWAGHQGSAKYPCHLISEDVAWHEGACVGCLIIEHSHDNHLVAELCKESARRSRFDRLLDFVEGLPIDARSKLFTRSFPCHLATALAYHLIVYPTFCNLVVCV